MARTLSLKDWRDLPEETTAMERVSLRDLEQRFASFVLEAEAGIRKFAKTVAARNALTENVDGDLIFVEETKLIYEWDDTAKEWKELKLPEGHAHFMEHIDWVIAEEVTAGTIPGPFRRVATESVGTLFEVEFEITGGTSAEFELKINGTAVKFEGGSTKAQVKKAAEARKLETPKELHSKDKITLVCTAATAKPVGLSFTAFVEHVSKVV